MACITLFAQPVAMATTQLTRITRYEDTSTWQLRSVSECNPLRMSWAVVTDNSGNRKLQMRWATSEDIL
jgi:hypothetical protein